MIPTRVPQTYDRLDRLRSVNANARPTTSECHATMEPRALVVAFLTGVSIACVLLTREYTVGEDVLSALASDADGMRARARIEALEPRSALSAALASTKLSLALWSRVFAPVINVVRRRVALGVGAAAKEATRIVRETEPRVLVQWALAVVGAAYVYYLCWQFVKHLKRARYRNKLKFFIIRMRLRMTRRVRAVLEPYARVYRRVAAGGAAVRRRYGVVVREVRSKSRLAANALPHVLFFAVAISTFRIMPRFVRKIARKREVLATVALLTPMVQTMLAMESDDMVRIEKWLRFWASCAPFMVAVDFPLISYSVRWFFPWWPELLVIFTIWLNSRLTRGSHIILESASPLVSRALTHLNEPSGKAGRASMFLRRSVRQALQVGVIVIRFRSRRASEALRLVLDNMSVPLVMCTVFFFTPGLITVYGCDMAGLVVPFVFTIDGLLKYNQIQAQAQHPNRAQVRKEMEKRQENSLKNLLTYWLAHAMIWSLCQELSKSALAWFPLWRHTQLAGIYWLQVFGGSQLITQRMQGIKESIMEDHQRALKAAISADLEASSDSTKVASETELKKESDETDREDDETVAPAPPHRDDKEDEDEVQADDETTTVKKPDVGLTADTVRKRNVPVAATDE